MKKTWTYQFGRSKIEIVNTWLGGCSLLVNDHIQDVNHNLISGSLRAVLESGEIVLANLGQGLLGIKCRLYVNGKEIKPIMINGISKQTGTEVQSEGMPIKRKSRKCTNCGAKTKADVCEYCGEELD